MNTKPHIRLNAKYIETIKSLAKKFFNSEDVWIFGSRADKNRKGGDIDIFIRTKKSKNILQLKIKFLREFEKILGEQKVDLIVQSIDSKDKNIFRIARTEGIKL